MPAPKQVVLHPASHLVVCHPSAPGHRQFHHTITWKGSSYTMPNDTVLNTAHLELYVHFIYNFKNAALNLTLI